MGKGRNEDLTVTRRKGLSRVWKNREGYLYWGGGVVQREEKVEGIIGRKGIGIGLIFFANKECKFLGRGEGRVERSFNCYERREDEDDRNVLYRFRVFSSCDFSILIRIFHREFFDQKMRQVNYGFIKIFLLFI